MVLLPSLRDGETATKPSELVWNVHWAQQIVEKERDLASVLRATTNGE
jgi:hypothetical protein